ncbi:MAG TPA: hypothetical protein VIW45_19405 [Vicinamibacterales bacterium]
MGRSGRMDMSNRVCNSARVERSVHLLLHARVIANGVRSAGL